MIFQADVLIKCSSVDIQLEVRRRTTRVKEFGQTGLYKMRYSIPHCLVTLTIKKITKATIMNVISASMKLPT